VASVNGSAVGMAEETLEEVFSHQRPALVGALARLVGSAATAEDLAHEAYHRAKAAIGEHEVDSLSAFLYRTARNLALDHMRRRRVENRIFVVDAEAEMVEGVAEPAPSPEAVVASRQSLAAVEAALAGLSPRQREVLVMARLHGATYGEIAARLGVSQSTVQKELKAALAVCADALAGA